MTRPFQTPATPTITNESWAFLYFSPDPSEVGVRREWECVRWIELLPPLHVQHPHSQAVYAHSAWQRERGMGWKGREGEMLSYCEHQCQVIKKRKKKKERKRKKKRKRKKRKEKKEKKVSATVIPDQTLIVLPLRMYFIYYVYCSIHTYIHT